MAEIQKTREMEMDSMNTQSALLSETPETTEQPSTSRGIIPTNSAALEDQKTHPNSQTPADELSASNSQLPHSKQHDLPPLPPNTPLRPIRDILNRIEWDPSCCNSADIIIGYLDRHDGILEIDFKAWKKDTTEDEFIPQHRIRYVKQKTDGLVLWDREGRVDCVFGSGRGRVEGWTRETPKEVELAMDYSYYE